jgi:hypothetical protein
VWDRNQFSQREAGFYKSLENQREFIDQIGSSLGINSLEDWYGMSYKRVSEAGGLYGLAFLHAKTESYLRE